MKLGDLVTFRTGKLDSNAGTVNGPYPFFTCSRETYRTDTFAFDTEAVLLAGNNAAGVYPLKYFKGRFNAYQRTYVITSNDGGALTNRFLYYAMAPLLKHFQAISTGAATKFLTLGLLKNVHVSIPPINCQDRIVSILSAYDDLIENNTRRIAILEEIVRQLYEEWFVNFRFHGYEQAIFDGTELGPVPNGWSVFTLEQLCKRITDGAHKSPPTVDGGLPMASVKDMHDWGFNVSKCRTISRNDFDELARNDCKPLIGDVLIAKDGSYLKHTFVMEKEADLVILSSIAILRPNDRIRPNLLAIALRHPDVVARMKGVVSGVAIPRIVLKDFRKFKIIVPPLNLQDEWEKIVGTMISLCRRLVDTNTNLRAQRDLLLPKLVTGEIDVSQVPEPEVAAA
jgi:type I restriction enzyme S subunit